MSVFRIRDNKKRPVRKAPSSNLSTMHQGKLADFSKSRSRLSDVEAKLEDVQRRILELEGLSCKSIDQMKELAELRDQEETMIRNKQRLQSCSDMMDYYYNTSELISSYSDLDMDPSRSTVTITNFFRDYSDGVLSEQTGKKKTSVNKKDLLEEYLEVTDPEYIRGLRTDDFCFCDACNEEMTLKKETGIFICTSCGLTNSVLVENTAGKASVPDSTKYSVYQRKNHFKEWLNQIQAKESTDIPQDVIDMIVLELNKIHFENLAELDPTLIRGILKKLSQSKYYENVFHIIYRLNGLQPPTLSREAEEQLLHYFKQIEEPFRIYKKKGRKNILRYSYILYKLCELLELDEFLGCFRLLKNRNKLMEQDIVWSSICRHLGWEFIPSM